MLIFFLFFNFVVSSILYDLLYFLGDEYAQLAT